MGFSKSSAKGKVHSNTSLTSRNEKNQINNLTLHLKQLEKEEMKNLTVSRRKEIIKIRAEINAKETKETIAKINKAKSWFFEKINKIDKPLARKKGRRIKSTKLEMKMEKSQQTTQKYKGSSETTIINYMPIKWTTWMKGTNS